MKQSNLKVTMAWLDNAAYSELQIRELATRDFMPDQQLMQ